MNQINKNELYKHTYLKIEDGEIFRTVSVGSPDSITHITDIALTGNLTSLAKKIMHNSGIWEVIEENDWIFRFEVERVLDVKEGDEPTVVIFKFRYRDWHFNNGIPEHYNP